MAGKIRLKPEFAKQLRKLLANNQPELANENFKNYIKKMVAATNYKLESILVHNIIPKDLERWLKRYAKQHGFKVSFSGGQHYKISITTDKTREVAEQQRKDEVEFYDNWINSPG